MRFLFAWVLLVLFTSGIALAETEEAMVQVTPFASLKSLVSYVGVDGLIGTLFALTMAFISAHFYNHKDGRYAKGKHERIHSPASFRFVYRYIQLTTIVASIGTYLTHGSIFLLVHQSLMLFYLGLAVAAIAIALFVTAKLNLGEHYSPCFDSYMPKDIIQEGLYRYIRHPIYMSNILLLTGMFISTGSLWIALNLVVLTIYYIRSAQEEETALRQRFPAYREYVARTNMLFPSYRIWFRNEYKKQVSH
jgi:protein-S-isoprenylcysteine O-methyltransferase Ste14